MVLCFRYIRSVKPLQKDTRCTKEYKSCFRTTIVDIHTFGVENLCIISFSS